MEKAITTALLVIASVVAAVALVNAILPTVTLGSSAVASSSGALAERMRTDVDIIFAAGNTATNTVTFWAKNVGTQTVNVVERSDLFLTVPTTGARRIPYDTGAEKWTYVLEDSATEWSQTKTVKVTITLTSLATGVYSIQFVLPNGAQAEKQFSV